MNQLIITLHSIHQNLIPLHQHRYIVKKNGVENFGKRSTRSNEKFKWHQSINKKQAACKIISWVMDKRITIHSARISIYFLQNSYYVTNILAEGAGEHHTGKEKHFLCGKENSKKFVHSFFLTLKMHEHNICLAQRWDFVQRFKRNKNHLYISCLEDEKR